MRDRFDHDGGDTLAFNDRRDWGWLEGIRLTTDIGGDGRAIDIDDDRHLVDDSDHDFWLIDSDHGSCGRWSGSTWHNHRGGCKSAGICRAKTSLRG